MFQKDERHTLCRQWFTHVGLNISDLSDKQLRARLDKVRKPYDTFSKSLHRGNNEAKLKDYLFQQQSHFPLVSAMPTVPSVVPCAIENAPATPPADHPTGDELTHLKIASSGRQLAALRRSNEELSGSLLEAKNREMIYKDLLKEKTQSVTTLQADLTKLQGKAERSASHIKCVETQLCSAKEYIGKIRQTNFYKRLKRQETNLKKREENLKDHEDGGCIQTIERLKHKLKLCQTANSSLRAKLNSVKEKRQQDLDRHNQLTADLLEEAVVHTVKTTEEGPRKKFTHDVIKTTIGLISCGVSAKNSGHVIQTVARNLFHTDIDDKDVPSERTSLRFADQGHYLAKYHVAETVLDSDNFDIHFDGTTRDHRKYVGQQVTTSAGSLSCGFTEVATEDAKTLVDVTVSLLQEVAQVYDKERCFKAALQKCSGLMSDRAAPNKLMKKDFNDLRKATLGTEEDLQFLYCNAHYLLGLGTSAEKSLKELQTEWGQQRIGRDNAAQFGHWQAKEAAAVRYVRMACEVLGPRGDDQCGCRDAWLAYCEMTNKTSTVPSFKSNRFNSIFYGATKLLAHRDDIIEFLSDYMPSRNQKLESVLKDAQSEEVNVFVATLAMVYERITGPYWTLLCAGETSYAEFFLPVVELHAQLREWRDDSASIFSPHVPSLFSIQVPDASSLAALLDLDEATQQKVQRAFSHFCVNFVAVTERQLDDFLPGGRYHAVQDPQVLERLRHSHITNLLGEACFGDLDISIYTHRNSSVHHHSTLTMLKRNKTMKAWFNQKSNEEQRQLLLNASSSGPEMRKRHRENDREVKASKRQKLQLQQQRTEADRQKKAREKADIAQEIRQDGGACSSAGDVDRLLERKALQREKLAALKTQIRFFRHVLGFKSELLKLTQDLPGLEQSLKEFLASQDPFPEHRDRVDNNLDEEDEPSESDSSASEHENDQRVDSDGFSFAQTGQTVAVFYDETFHVGTVTNILSADEAKVNFLKKSSLDNNRFSWPAKEDSDTVSSVFVFAWDFLLEPISTNARMWHVPNSTLQEQYNLYVEKYC
ncbi:uncharacterized protein [Littorina saxatilis]|uniref:Uncharacterized protein n=1 Tax=Littorina saxatilis TaxID=31220 RepID=A0AAN9BG91_9CAEN